MILDKNNLPKELPLGKAEDLRKYGKFGELTPIYKCEWPENVKNHTTAYWLCKCDCGEFTRAKSSHLKTNKIITCGHSKAEDLTGQKFGKLTVMYRVENQGINKDKVAWHCICECTNELDVRADSLKDGNTRSCGCILSYGEELIGHILSQNNIKYHPQKMFDTCIFQDTLAKAKFDFYIVDKNYLIEFDGGQHFAYYQSSKIFTKEKLAKTQEHDRIKNQWCKDNNIPLIRIPFWRIDNLCLEDLLLETTTFLVEQ